MSSTRTNQTQRSMTMLEFKLWLESVPDWWIRQQVLDAYYKGYFEGATSDDTHDLQRYFMLSKRGIDMVPKIDPPKKKGRKRPCTNPK